jgi:bifunctional non-homologous end joining protein LigD
MRFIPPARPTLRFAPPRGDQRVHKVKFDGWRIQLHKYERGATIFTSNGLDFTHRLPAIEALVASGNRANRLPSSGIGTESLQCRER